MKHFILFGLLLATFSALTLAGPVGKQCVAGLKAINVDTGATLIDYAEFQTCKAGQSCAVLESSYRAFDGVKVGTSWYWGCVNEAEVMPWLSYFTSNAAHGLPNDAKLISAGNKICRGKNCFDYTLPEERKDGLTCYTDVYVVDDETNEIIKSAPKDFIPEPTMKCHTHQESCQITKIPFTLENGKKATEVTTGCTDHYDYGYDRYYPQASDNPKFCEANGCMEWAMGCICFGDDKIAGRGNLDKTTCNGSLCNSV